MGNQNIIRTDTVLVRTMELAEGAATDWHYHTEVKDLFVCLTGAVHVESRDPDEVILLQPGQRAEICPPHVHRVVNDHKGTSEYLLVQGTGAYDFNKV